MAEPAASSSVTSDRALTRKSTTNRRTVEGETTAGHFAKALIPATPATRPPCTPLTDPIFEYTHSDGISISGGFVYRGTALGAAYATGTSSAT